jgi:hypothetical protein
VAKMRTEAVSAIRKVVAQEDNPLTVIVGFVMDENLDVATRMSAANIALPYLYPKLSASTVDSRSTIVNVDAGAVMDRLAERLDRLARPIEEVPTIEAYPDVVIAAEDDEDAEADDTLPAA